MFSVLPMTTEGRYLDVGIPTLGLSRPPFPIITITGLDLNRTHH